MIFLNLLTRVAGHFEGAVAVVAVGIKGLLQSMGGAYMRTKTCDYYRTFLFLLSRTSEDILPSIYKTLFFDSDFP